MEQTFTLLTLKMQSVTHLLTPRPADYVRSSLGLAGHYRPFVSNFASIASPLTRLLKDTPFIWHDAQTQAFEALKHVLTQARFSFSKLYAALYPVYGCVCFAPLSSFVSSGQVHLCVGDIFFVLIFCVYAILFCFSFYATVYHFFFSAMYELC